MNFSKYKATFSQEIRLQNALHFDKLKYYLFCVGFLLINIGGYAEYYEESPIKFVENKGQWQGNILFRADIPDGVIYLERDRITYLFKHPDDIERIHSIHHGYEKFTEPIPIRSHAYQVLFEGSDLISSKGVGFSTDYNNYFLGNDSSKWATDVKKFSAVEYKSLYPGIDFRIYTGKDGLKYDFILQPGADPSEIQLKYIGVDEMKMINHDLVVGNSINNVIEKRPKSFQESKIIRSDYTLNGNVIGFELEKYDESKQLIIDPDLVFASYSGSTADNWGCTATYDDAGHLYGGGTCFGDGYPTTIGAFQTSWGGGTVGSYISDIVISKYSPNGSTLLYSTYVGGNKSDCPHSLIVDADNNLIILATTSSSDYPVTAGAYDVSFNGGTNSTPSGISFQSGSDLAVTKINQSGTALIGSTYIGGSGNDGLNVGSASNLDYNYGDYFRGEVIVDQSNNILIASCTRSGDFPMVGSYQSAFGGQQDAIVFQLNSTLTSLDWSTYLGGTDHDAAYSLKQNNLGEVFVVGGTQSSDYPYTIGAYHTNYGGVTDGFISKLNSSGSVLLASSFIGTSEYDQVYFVELDSDQDIYIVGQTEGTYPISAGVYSNPNSGQFVQKLTPDLQSSIFSTTIGRQSGEIDISLSAFLVNECDHIYISGWGGATNSSGGQASFSTTAGLPISSDAFQSSTDGSDFYLMVLDQNATGLIYASYFGGAISAEHVDGGTSRFDKNGIVYQAVCGGCGGNSDFPTSSGAWSQTNNSMNCNTASFKFDLSQFSAIADVLGQYHCEGDGVSFQNNSTGGTGYTWYFGDGQTSNSNSPVHFYNSPGVYDVMLVVTDPTSCIVADTSFLSVTVTQVPQMQYIPVDTICPGDTVMLIVSGAETYNWVPATGLSSTTIQNPIALATSDIEYTVTGSTICGSSDIMVPVNVYTDPISVVEDTSICKGDSVWLYAGGGVSYEWSPSGLVDFPDSNYTLTYPPSSVTFFLDAVDSKNCEWTKTITVNVDTNQPIAFASTDTIVCLGDTAHIWASGGTKYNWTPNLFLSNNQSSAPLSYPTTDILYTVEVRNGCGKDYAEVLVRINELITTVIGDTLACGGDSIQLWVLGGESYIWSPSTGLNDMNSNKPMVLVERPTSYQVVVFDSLNCAVSHFVSIDTFPKPIIDAGDDFLVEWSKNGVLNPIAPQGTYQWSPSNPMNCDTCLNPSIEMFETTMFHLTVTDENGCVAIDSVTVFVSGSIYVPNTFTPNQNALNDMFYAYGKEIKDFEMLIFNRWGQQIFQSNDINIGWDGTYKGNECQIGTYVWKIWWREYSGTEGKAIGHVNLVR